MCIFFFQTLEWLQKFSKLCNSESSKLNSNPRDYQHGSEVYLDVSFISKQSKKFVSKLKKVVATSPHPKSSEPISMVYFPASPQLPKPAPLSESPPNLICFDNDFLESTQNFSMDSSSNFLLDPWDAVLAAPISKSSTERHNLNVSLNDEPIEVIRKQIKFKPNLPFSNAAQLPNCCLLSSSLNNDKTLERNNFIDSVFLKDASANKFVCQPECRSTTESQLFSNLLSCEDSYNCTPASSFYNQTFKEDGKCAIATFKENNRFDISASKGSFNCTCLSEATCCCLVAKEISKSVVLNDNFLCSPLLKEFFPSSVKKNSLFNSENSSKIFFQNDDYISNSSASKNSSQSSFNKKFLGNSKDLLEITLIKDKNPCNLKENSLTALKRNFLSSSENFSDSSFFKNQLNTSDSTNSLQSSLKNQCNPSDSTNSLQSSLKNQCNPPDSTNSLQSSLKNQCNLSDSTNSLQSLLKNQCNLSDSTNSLQSSLKNQCKLSDSTNSLQSLLKNQCNLSDSTNSLQSSLKNQCNLSDSTNSLQSSLKNHCNPSDSTNSLQSLLKNQCNPPDTTNSLQSSLKNQCNLSDSTNSLQSSLKNQCKLSDSTNSLQSSLENQYNLSDSTNSLQSSLKNHCNPLDSTNSLQSSLKNHCNPSDSTNSLQSLLKNQCNPPDSTNSLQSSLKNQCNLSDSTNSLQSSLKNQCNLSDSTNSLQSSLKNQCKLSDSRNSLQSSLENQYNLSDSTNSLQSSLKNHCNPLDSTNSLQSSLKNQCNLSDSTNSSLKKQFIPFSPTNSLQSSLKSQCNPLDSTNSLQSSFKKNEVFDFSEINKPIESRFESHLSNFTDFKISNFKKSCLVDTNESSKSGSYYFDDSFSWEDVSVDEATELYGVDTKTNYAHHELENRQDLSPPPASIVASSSSISVNNYAPEISKEDAVDSSQDVASEAGEIVDHFPLKLMLYVLHSDAERIIEVQSTLPINSDHSYSALCRLSMFRSTGVGRLSPTAFFT